jgi:hypothetical protein
MQRLLIALLLFIVGTGNIVFGLVKLEEYQILALMPPNIVNNSKLLKSFKEPTTIYPQSAPSPAKASFNEHSKEKTLAKLSPKHENRLQFYRLTVITGCGLLISSMLIQCYWWYRAKK